jgi:hypothetical protein
MTATAPKPAEKPAPAAASSRSALWVLAVFVAFMVGGALWFATVGAPQPNGLAVPAGSAAATGTASWTATATTSGTATATTTATAGSTTASGAPSATGSAGAIATPTVAITRADVEAVLAQTDYTESSVSSTTAYDHMLVHLLAGVDEVTFAQNTLETTSGIVWNEPGSAGPAVAIGADKSALIAAATAAYLKRQASLGDSVALSDMVGVRLFPPTRLDRNLPDSQLEVMAQGLAPLGVLTGDKRIGKQWEWTVEDITVTGPNSADVVYSAKTLPGAKFKFADPQLHYTKHLTFIGVADGRWQLAGWSNYAQVRAKLLGNVRPKGALQFDPWWGAL